MKEARIFKLVALMAIGVGSVSGVGLTGQPPVGLAQAAPSRQPTLDKQASPEPGPRFVRSPQPRGGTPVTDQALDCYAEATGKAVLRAPGLPDLAEPLPALPADTNAAGQFLETQLRQGGIEIKGLTLVPSKEHGQRAANFRIVTPVTRAELLYAIETTLALDRLAITPVAGKCVEVKPMIPPGRTGRN